MACQVWGPVVGLDLGGNGELLAQAAGICNITTAILSGKSYRGFPMDTRAVGVLSSTSRFHAMEPGQVVLVARIGGAYNQLWELAAGADVGQGGSRHMHSGKGGGQWQGLKPSTDATGP